MRVISGSCRGRKLSPFNHDQIRPTSDKVREAIFSILPHTKKKAKKILDLFAGTGALGIEALSRATPDYKDRELDLEPRHEEQAKQNKQENLLCVFIEESKKAADIIRKNIQTCSFEENSWIITKTVEKALPVLSTKKVQFELVFIDAPYKDLAPTTCAMEDLIRLNLLAKGATLVVEIPSKGEALPSIEGLLLEKEKKYGDTKVCFFRFD
ncbi:MAG: RsmD family RNA methyltransferase [Deltaproteobacteria bacterium]|nr:RsmD family RNA methyltransferase [Deltaproteobacteria bacterium]